MSPALLRSPPRVLIIGSGVGGLALAQGLRKSGIPFRVFERDPSADYRPQGYRLKINGDGANALRTVLSEQGFEYFERSCAESFPGETNINALDCGLISSRAGSGSRPGPVPYLADRTVLRGILLDNIQEDISFGKQLQRYDITENGVTAHFTDGTAEEGSLLVGADGLHSQVRKQYQPEHKPVDTNGTCIYGKTPMSDELLEAFPIRALKWMTLVLDRTPMTQTLDIDETPVTLLLEPVRFVNAKITTSLPEDYVYWVLISRSDVFSAARKELSTLGGDQSSAALSLHITQEWDPRIRSLLKLQDVSQASTLTIASARPNIPSWTASGRVTLIGDAVHVMSPCGGIGAVTALLDAATLTKSLVAGGLGSESVKQYETVMRLYAQKSIERSYTGGKKMFGQRWFDDCQVLDL